MHINVSVIETTLSSWLQQTIKGSNAESSNYYATLVQYIIYLFSNEKLNLLQCQP